VNECATVNAVTMENDLTQGEQRDHQTEQEQQVVECR